MKKDIFILGLSLGCNSTVALLKNGEIIACYHEERYNRKKNFLGFPKLAIKNILRDYCLKGSDLTTVALNFHRFTLVSEKEYGQELNSIYDLQLQLTYNSRFLNFIFEHLYTLYLRTINKHWQDKLILELANNLQIKPDQIKAYKHHLTHAASVVYAMGKHKDKILVLTNDGAGDDYSASVNIYSDYSFHELALTHNKDSLGAMYAAITTFLGMKSHEHEYKVMGLAPYTNPKSPEVQKTKELLLNLFEIDGLKIRSRIDCRHNLYFLDKKFKRKRFDWIAYAAQELIEEKLAHWVKNAVMQTGINHVCCAGGVFMNVKANKVIAELDCVKDLTIMPSSSDESSAIGTAYLGYIEYCKQNAKPALIKPLNNLYLGNQVTNQVIKKYINKYNLNQEFKIDFVDDPEKEVAKLLMQGKIVARFSGRMEFGQRALGNRSILANPSLANVIRKLNDQIKARDFWMPFAGSILEECESEYIINPKKLKAYYMMLSFDSTQKAKDTIFAALHPYDYTIRPQIVTKRINPKYHYLISEFKKLTGIGAVLNTSFNLHGEPIVASIENAVSTFRSSGLEYLQMENYLVQKK